MSKRCTGHSLREWSGRIFAVLLLIAFGVVSSRARGQAGPPNVTLTQPSNTTGTTTDNTLTFQATNNEVDLTILANSTLTISGQDINKTGSFNSIMSGGILTSSTGSLIVNVDGSGGTLEIDSAIESSPFAPAGLVLTKSGVGTLILGSTATANNFGGGLDLNSGAVQISSALNLGASNNPVNFNGGTLQTANALTLTNVLNIGSGGGTINLIGNGSITLGSNQLVQTAVTNVPTLNLTGSGTLILAGFNNFSAPVSLNSGTLQLQSFAALENSNGAFSPITLTAGNAAAFPQLNLHPLFDGANTITLGNTITLNGQSGSSFGNIDFGASNTGTTGTIALAGQVSVSNATLNLTGNVPGIIESPVAISGSSTINNAANVTLEGGLTGTGTFVKTGAGTMDFNSQTSSTFNGTVAVNGGLLTLSDTNATAITGNLVIGGGTVRLNASNQLGRFSIVTLNSGAFRLNGQSNSIAELVNNGGDFSTGRGTLFVTNVSTTAFNGGTNTINSGGTLNTLHLTISGGVNVVQAAGNIIVGSGGVDFLLNASPSISFNSDVATPGLITLGGNVSFSGTAGTAGLFNSGAIPIAGTIDLGGASRTFTVADGTAAIDMSVGGTITDGALVKDGPGLLQLNTASSYAGGTTLTLGTLQITDPGALGSGAVTFNGGTLDLRSDLLATSFANALSASATTSSNVVIDRVTPGTAGIFVLPSMNLGAALNLSGSSGGTFEVVGPVVLQSSATINNSVDINLAGVVSGAFGFNKTLGGTLILSGAAANTYSGLTTVSGGTLALSKATSVNAIAGNLTIAPGGTVKLLASEQINDASSVVLNATGQPAVFNLNDQTETIASIADNGTGGTIQLGTIGTGLLNFGSANDAQTFSGNVTGAGAIAKFGTGTYSFTGSANTFTGGASVHAGTLRFTNNAPDYSGTTLTGGSWTIFSGATLAFPAGATVVTNDGKVTLNGASPAFSALNPLASNQNTFALASGAHFTTAGSLTNDGTVLVNGNGSLLSVSGGLTNTGTPAATGTTTVGAAATLAAKSVSQNNLTVNGVLNIAPKTSGGGQSVVDKLTVAGTTNSWTGKLDLADNSLIVNYSGASPAATIANQIKEAYGATGHWDGSGGITSSSAASDPSQFALGYADGADHVAAGLPAGQVLVQYTRAGDANLDGIVNVVDLGILATHYGHAGTWDQGDYNYDGVVNVVDLGILATNYGHGTSLTASQAALQFQQDLTLFPEFQSVPEPSALAMLALGACLLWRGRGGHQHFST